MFEFNFRDERYLPFERAGAISKWQIELSTEKELRQFDYSTISDVILHLDYTARENGGEFKAKATTYIKDFITNVDGLTEQPFMQLFSMKHEFPTEWHRFLNPAVEGDEQILAFTLGKERFPFFAQDRNLVVLKMHVLARCAKPMTYHAMLSYQKANGTIVTSTPDPLGIEMPQSADYGYLNKATINENDFGLNLTELDVAGAMRLKLRSTSASYNELTPEPPEVDELYLIVHYKLA
jgi:hypothetical protein